MSLHLTKKAAMSTAATRNANQQKRGKSSGWKRIDHVVKPSGRLIRRWEVAERSL